MPVSLEDGAHIIVSIPSEDGSSINEYHGALLNQSSGAHSFAVECEALYQDFDQIKENQSIKVYYQQRDTMYEIAVLVAGCRETDAMHLVDFESKSDALKSERMLSPKHEISVICQCYKPAKMGTTGNDMMITSDDLVLTGQVFDISDELISILTSELVQIEPFITYYLHFTLGDTDNFLLPAKMMRQGNSLQTALFKYDYIFFFDNSKNRENQTKLLNAILMHKMKKGRYIPRR